jgi:hypothetical protein
MNSGQKRIFAALVLICAFYFALFIFPNNTGAKDQMMISLFEPDEFAQFPIVLKMLTPREQLDKTLLNFIAYRHYYYGSPFYFSSALLVLPLQLAGNIYQHTQLAMLLLRQFISVLPMLGALLLLTFIQTRFTSCIKSIGLLIFLLSISAVVENNMWWHVDSLAVFFVALTLFFLDRDEMQYGRNFHLAAAATGLGTGTKVISLFFFLAIPAYLIAGRIAKRITWRTLRLRAGSFLAIMAITIVLANPFLLLPSQAARMIRILGNQSAAMSTGWTLTYEKGIGSWLPIIERLYGMPAFNLLAFLVLALGIWKSRNRMRHLLIALWALPLGAYILFTIAIKPTHFFLPILLPVYSSMIVLFELPPFVSGRPRNPLAWLWGGAALAIIGMQFVLHLREDVRLYREVLTREDHEESLIFYDVLQRDYLPRIQPDETLVFFRDVRMYVPADSRWVVRTYWNSKYSTIEQIQPDLILLWSQRILDYTQEGAREQAADPASFQDTYEFYVDADNDRLRGYRLIYRDAEGLFFVSDEMYVKFFAP